MGKRQISVNNTYSEMLDDVYLEYHEAAIK